MLKTLQREGLIDIPSRPNTLWLTLSTAAITVVSLAVPLMTLQIYDRIMPSQGSGTLPILTLGVLIAIALEATLRLSRAYFMSSAGAFFEHQLSIQLLKHVMHANMTHMGGYGTGEHMHKMSTAGKLRDFYNGYTFVTLIELMLVPLFLGLSFYIAGTLAVIPLVVLLLFTLVSVVQGRSLRFALEHRSDTDDIRYDYILETLSGIHTVKAFGLEKKQLRHYESLQGESTQANLAVTDNMANTFNMAAVFSSLMVLAIILFGAYLVIQGDITSGALIATILLSGRILQPIQRALALWARYQDARIAADKIAELKNMPLRPQADFRTPDIRQGLLEFKKATFRFSDDEPALLDQVTFALQKNDILLLDGAHGSGKSVILELIAGVYAPQDGSILIDQQNLLNFSPEDLTKHVGYVSENARLFMGTIRENLTRFGKVPADKVSELCQLLAVDRDVAQLPAGYDTRVTGDGTDKIPPGLRQRIAIVRVLAQKPRLILFDSADTGLDREGYQLIFKLLSRLKGKATMVLVSEDRNIRALANKHARLEDGKILLL